ncbi:MAG TPA: hypothetical protein PKM73_21205 [Verrucomicrobiota bacterium]|nr:hypothetical protein [Verrucomicrobiota bacterium]HNU53303.1 hypothetical protein [Verrucomicrobiota bacterium]
MSEDVGEGGRGFQTTDWTQVRAAGGAEGEARQRALAAVFTIYRGPLLAHLRRTFRVGEDQAIDWLHDFIHRKVLLANVLRCADRNRGKFRTFFIASLDRFVLDQQRRARAQRRMPARGFVPLDQVSDEDIARQAEAGAAAMAWAWAKALLEETLRRMEGECIRKGCPQRWEVFKAHVLDPLYHGAEALPYAVLVERFGLRSPAEASNTFNTATRMFERLLRQVVREYACLGPEADVEEELRQLRRDLGWRG